MDSPLGPLTLMEEGDALTRLVLPGGAPAPGQGEDSPLLTEAARQLRAYFSHRLRRFDLPLAPGGTPFQRAVWARMAVIPFGETDTYGALARALGRPGGARAVGQACHRNPLPILLPCHRVVGSKKALTGYAGGLEVKKFLLEWEGWA